MTGISSWSLHREKLEEVVPALNAAPELMPPGSMVNMGLLIVWRQSDIRKEQHVNNFLNKFCTNTLFPPNGNVALLNNWEAIFISGKFSWDLCELGQSTAPRKTEYNWYFTWVAQLVFRWALCDIPLQSPHVALLCCPGCYKAAPHQKLQLQPLNCQDQGLVINPF